MGERILDSYENLSVFDFQNAPKHEIGTSSQDRRPVLSATTAGIKQAPKKYGERT